MAFKDWQADYAAHGIATFPCEITPDGKKPLVKNYQRFGLPGSAQIAGRFADASALGFMGGRKNGITPLDVDSTSDKDLADAIGRHGDTPIITRTGSEHAQLWYRYNSERRRIRVFGPDVRRLMFLVMVAMRSVHRASAVDARMASFRAR